MGFLDNSTNNILVDAVLTDMGRLLISQNSGGFIPVKFGLGDEEVDYTIIRKYGLTVGKEKITKNTCVFEAQTHSTLGLKYNNLSLGKGTYLRLPSYQLKEDATSGLISMTIATIAPDNLKMIGLEQQIVNQGKVPDELQDGIFVIKMQNAFLYIPGMTPTVDMDNIATYEHPETGENSTTGGSALRFRIRTRPINQFSTFSTYANANLIKTYVRIMGFNSGAEATVEIQINNTAL